jgi:hypothetical protein
MRQRNFSRKVQQERYRARRFQNPYFQKETKRSWKPWVIAIGIVFCISAGLGALGSAPVFATQSIEVSGTETISSDDIKALVQAQFDQPHFFFFSPSNSFLFNKESIQDTLASRYSFESIDVTRTCDFLSIARDCQLHLLVKEKTSQLLWQSANAIYLADLQGVVIRELTSLEITALTEPDPMVVTVTPPEGTPVDPAAVVPISPPIHPLKRLPLFSDINESPVTVGTPVLSSEEVAGMFQFRELAQTVPLSINKIDIDRLAGKWVRAQTTADFDVLFDPLADVPGQIERLKTVLTQTITDVDALQYIDVRFGDRVYYK